MIRSAVSVDITSRGSGLVIVLLALWLHGVASDNRTVSRCVDAKDCFGCFAHMVRNVPERRKTFLQIAPCQRAWLDLVTWRCASGRNA